MTFPGASSYLDRHGKRRWRFRRGKKTIQLPGDPAASLEFRAAYNSAFKGVGFSISELVRREDIAHSFFREWISHAKNRRKKKNISFELDANYLASLIVAQSFKCAVSGIEVEFKTAWQKRYRRHPFIASVDRIDNDKGYEPGNVRIVCLIVNLARSDFGDEPLYRMAKAIVSQRA